MMERLDKLKYCLDERMTVQKKGGTKSHDRIPCLERGYSLTGSGSMFQILSAYSLVTRSMEKNPMRATDVIDLASHSSWFWKASSTISCVVMYELKSSETR